MYLSVIWIASLEKCLFRSAAHLKIRLLACVCLFCCRVTGVCLSSPWTCRLLWSVTRGQKEQRASATSVQEEGWQACPRSLAPLSLPVKSAAYLTSHTPASPQAREEQYMMMVVLSHWALDVCYTARSSYNRRINRKVSFSSQKLINDLPTAHGRWIYVPDRSFTQSFR